MSPHPHRPRWFGRLWSRLRAALGFGPRQQAPLRSRCFLAGFASFRRGLALRENPQPRGDAAAWLEWRRGYLAAQARAERRQALIEIGQDSDSHFDLPIIDPRR
jgi:hypothetical protein